MMGLRTTRTLLAGLLALLALAPLAARAAEVPTGSRFEEISGAAGLDFVHSTRSFGDRHKAEVLEMFTDGGAAVAVGDFDGDGFDDLFLTDSGEGRPNRLMRNLVGETGELRFEDVTAEAGVAGGNDERSIVADGLWLDFDDDGRLDLLVSRFGTPLLYRQTESGEESVPRFVEVAGAAGLTEFGNTIAAIAFDYDGDGWLDLLFGNYFRPVNLLDLETPHVLPEDLDDAHNGGGVTLWRNVPAESSTATGGRKFVQVTEEAGLAHHTGWSLDLGHGDLDNDGDQDVYVASDYGTDRLFFNDGDGTFTDATEEVLGFDTKKGMNVDMADYDRNGWLDVYVTNITDEYMRECNMLWHNAGDGAFLDLSKETGTCDSDWGWAAKFGDFDNDGWQDLFVVNGLRSAGQENYIPVLLEMIITPGIDFSDLNSYPDIGNRTWSGYQPQRLFHNRGDGTFREMATEAGLANDLDGRGIGVGDFDNDGRLDLYQSNARQRGLFYRNVTEQAGHWIALRLEGSGAGSGDGPRRGSNRGAVGARVTVTTNGGETLLREVDCGNGYASQSSTRLHFGLGDADAVERVEIRWPSGRVQVLGNEAGKPPVPIDAVTRIVEGVDPRRNPEANDTEAAGHDSSEPGDLEVRLWHHRNLGKALYESSATQYEAVDEFEKALELAPDSARERVNLGLALLRAGRTEEGITQLERAQQQDPSIPHTWFNLGIAYKRQSEYRKAITQLEGMVERVPDEPITHYNLGVLYKLEGETEKALAHLERAAELAPRLAGPHFQLANTYRQQGRAEEARREMATFRELKASSDSEEDLEWSWYSEIYETLEPRPLPAPEGEPAFEARSPRAEPRVPRIDPETAGLEVLTADGDDRPDLLVWSNRGAFLLADGDEPLEAGLGDLQDVRSLAAGDFDDDGLDDLAVVTGESLGSGATGRLSLWANRGGHFEPLPGALPESLRSEGGVADRVYDDALWLDVDHDYDLDLVLLGSSSALLRNDGDGTFSDRTASFPFTAEHALAGIWFDLEADSQAVDLVVAHGEGSAIPGVLYRDLLGGRYEARPLPELPAGTRHLLAEDLNHDGWTDLVAASADGVTLLVNDHEEGFRAVPVAGAPGGAVALLDLDNRGASDLVVAGPGRTALLRARGRARFERASTFTLLPAVGALAASDFDADGRSDLALVEAAGELRIQLNRTQTDNHWLGVDLAGVKNPELARGAEVEIKAGTHYQKRLYHGTPLVFGLGDRDRVDTVRITWPNGMIQNEPRQEADVSATFEEAPRLSGSCPMIFTWNGSEFEFITDVLGVAPLGASAGDGSYFPVDHDEGIRIPRGALAPRQIDPTDPERTFYEIRMTEELREIAYLDEIRLAAVDHPADVEILTNDKFKGPPFPELRLYGAKDPLQPVAARDHRGRDVLDRVLSRDATYPDGFERTVDGIAEPHHLELDFGPDAPQGRALLVLSGWVDWADGSTFLRTAQGDGPGLALPSLQVQDASGRWVTVIEDMGLPAGKPKTIAVDLTGLLPVGWSKLRIATSLCVYWDEIYVTADPGPPTARLSELPLAQADLRFRGFSRVVIHPERKQPERFVYAERRPQTDWNWNPTPGLYTRYGRVEELLSILDDRFVIMGSGDEVRMLFDPSDLPPVPDGWVRDFILFVDGWAKDGDANTAHSQTVDPLPYHGMPQYPYEPPHRYPDDPAHTLYREQMLTRPALRLIRPLTEGAAPRRRAPTGGEAGGRP